jgi:hypothetical protein
MQRRNAEGVDERTRSTMQTPRPLTVRRRLPQLQEDLPADASLRIGVKFKPADCTRKAKNGDKLKVHYTG